MIDVIDVIVPAMQSSLISQDGLQAILKNLVLMAEKQLPGARGVDKEAWCTQRAITILELFDNSVPVLGAFADLPMIDALQASAVKEAVHRAWTMLVAAGYLSAETDGRSTR
jgi:hypothetical protein